MTVPYRVVSAIAGALLLAWLLPVGAWACSPPFEEPTIAALGPAQVVVVGTIGQPVPGGRAFHVDRWFNGGDPVTPLFIAFKEGEPIGDCSYPVAAGTDLIIAPYLDADGRLRADLSTLQADPSSELGQRYVAEATRLFGPGVVPPAPRAPAAPGPGSTLEVGYVALAIAVVALILFGMLAVFGRDRRRSG